MNNSKIPVGMTGIQQACAIRKANKMAKEVKEAMIEAAAIKMALQKK